MCVVGNCPQFSAMDTNDVDQVSQAITMTTATRNSSNRTFYPELVAMTSVLSAYASVLIVAGTIGNVLLVLGMSASKQRRRQSHSQHDNRNQGSSLQGRNLHGNRSQGSTKHSGSCRQGHSFHGSRTGSSNNGPRLLLALLAVCDTAVLWTAVLRYWLELTLHLDIRRVSRIACQLHSLLTYVTTDLAVALLCLLSLERLLAMRSGHRNRRLLSPPPRLALVLLLIALLVTAKHAPLLWILTLDPTTGECVYDSSRCDVAICPHTWVEFVSHSVLPYLILIPANLALHLLIRRGTAAAASTIHLSTKSRAACGSNLHRRGMVSSRILLCLSVLHMFTSFPALLYIELLGLFRVRLFSEPAAHNNSDSHDNDDSSIHSPGAVLYNSLCLLASTNNALNFFAVLYFSSEFRRSLASIFGFLPARFAAYSQAQSSNESTISVRRPRIESAVEPKSPVSPAVS